MVHFPVYTALNTLHTTLMSYEVAAVQHHFGDSPCGQKQFARGRHWLTDDSGCAQPSIPGDYIDTAYLVWMRQVTAAPTTCR